MTIFATTKSGSHYSFTQNEKGECFVSTGRMSGRIVKLYHPIEMGKKMEFEFIRNGMYGSPDEEEATFNESTEVVKLKVCF